MSFGRCRIHGVLLVSMLLVVASTGALGDEIMIFDFQDTSEAWANIDDVVMGGVSSSEMTMAGGVAVFRGAVSFANNGGFASIRTRPGVYDLSDLEGVVLRVRGDGKEYGFRLRTSDVLDGVSYQARLRPQSGQWTDVVLPFTTFEPVFRGRRVADHPPLDPSRIATFGFIISGQEGPFKLEIANIRGYRDLRRGSDNP